MQSMETTTEQYPIRNVRSKFPRDMSEEDKKARAMLVVSHFGWRRLSFDKHKDQMDMFRKGYNMEMKPFLDKADEAGRDFWDLQIPKDFFFSMGEKYPVYMRYFYDELCGEEAIEEARKIGIPVLVTLPCKTEESGLISKDNSPFRYLDYLNHHLAGREGVYVVPTFQNVGRLHGHSTPDFATSRTFHQTQGGREIFGDVLEKSWDRVYFAGGALGGCLSTTVRYFTGQKDLRILDDLCFSNTCHPFALPKEVIEQVPPLFVKLLKKDTEKEGRTNLLELMRPFDKVDKSKDYELFSRWPGLGKEFSIGVTRHYS